MTRSRLPTRRARRDGAGGRPSAPFALAAAAVLAATLLAAPASAQEARSAAEADDLAVGLAGLTLRDLAALPAVAPTLRAVVRSRQSAVFRHLRAPGTAARTREGTAWAWGCEGGDCAREGLLLAHHVGSGALWLLLLQDGDATLVVPPRRSTWPAVVREAVAEHRPDLAARLGGG